MTGATPAAIRVLPPEVAASIAAGEVVERPVSVVRELLDNAIDAGSTQVSVEIEDGGLGLIRVADNGHGIPPEQLEVAFERHATSKITMLDDLAHLHTLGFRGEALPSIAAAGDVEVLSRARGEPVGVHAVFIEARPARRSARPAPVGTSIAVRDLFARLPARRKFLASPAAEGRQVTVLVSHYALAYPGIAFHLSMGGRRLLATPGDGNIRHAFAAVYGAETGAAMLDTAYNEAEIGVTGLAGPPSVHRGNRSAISVFINGRWVQSRPLTFAVADAYQSQLPIGRHPIAALSITIPEADVDVNVHPAKAEVRFRDERLVGRVVRHAVLAALDASRPAAWGAPVGVSLQPAVVATVGGGTVALSPLRDRLQASSAPVAALRAPEPVQATLSWRTASGAPVAPLTQRELLPMLRVVGQVGATYVVAEGPDGMYLIDQHAAHERVVYDRLLARTGDGNGGAVQPLLEPALLELDLAACATLEEHHEQLAALGLAIEAFGERSYLIRAIPPGLGGTDVTGAIRAVLDQLAGERRVTDPFARAAATVACHSSVRAGTALSLEEMRQLVADLEATASPRTCPHGRPTLVHLSTDAVERQFGRR
ncbi:MAG: DNA mismatch repair endonuclease MutL [Chloroflexi bacterium]|nr:DNA mismatch repair endonuclease MutL [Chloroflexota bacterium]